MGSMFQKPSASVDQPVVNVHGGDTHSNDTVETVVGPSVHVEGDFVSDGNMVVKGSVKGSVKTSRLLTVERGARIVAQVEAGQAVISGDIQGNIHTSDRLELTESARVMGDISCGILVVAPGALLHGNVSMHDLDVPTKSASKGRAAKAAVREEKPEYDEDEE